MSRITMTSCLRRIFQFPAGLQNICKTFYFAGISKIFTNTIKIVYLEYNNENAVNYFSTTFKVA